MSLAVGLTLVRTASSTPRTAVSSVRYRGEVSIASFLLIGPVGMVFENVGKGIDVYPSVGMRQTNESIRANFGSVPFKFAIEEHIRVQRDVVWNNIMETSIDWSLLGVGLRKTEDESKSTTHERTAFKGLREDEESRAPLRKLVLAYLAHHGYARTARAFQRQALSESRNALGAADIEPKTEPVDEDVQMAVDDVPAVASAPGVYSTDSDDDFGFDRELNTRLSITNAIARGDIDNALSLIRAHHSTVLEREQGLILFRLRCRKFVELVLEAGEALRRVKEAEPSATPKASATVLDGDDIVGTMDGVGAMDVDDPSPEAHPFPSASVPVVSPSALAYSSSALPSVSSAPSPASTPVQSTHAALSAAARTSLHTALSYGQTLEADYKNDTRPTVRAHLRRTFGVVAYDDPIAAGGEVAEMAGQSARNALAAEVNQAILGMSMSLPCVHAMMVADMVHWCCPESQGRPAHPALETLFRQAGACVTQLGLLGVGAAAFADVRKEFIEG